MKLWHELFADQLERQPDAVALRDQGSSMSFSALDESANKLVGRLYQAGLRPGGCVGLAMRSCIDLVPCLLACAKAGVTFVPMDPSFPTQRLRHMAETAQVTVIVVKHAADESRLRLFLRSQKYLRVPLVGSGQTDSPAVRIDGSTLAYTLFTSGSTGQPKGVQIEHASLSNFLLSMGGVLGVTGTTPFRLLALTTPSFDISLAELLLPLVVGGEVLFAGEDSARDPHELAKVIGVLKPTHVQATPTTWQMLLSTGWKGEGGLTAICGGEVLSKPTAAGLLALGCSVYNAYGPTETTIYSSVGKIEDAEQVQVGEPIANTQFFIVDELLQPVADGGFGELCIGGLGLARGYLGLPEVNAAQFPTVSFAGVDDTIRIYRTGDRARKAPSGSFEIVGRIDAQIKLHGHRIEPGEIEARLLQQTGIAGAAVICADEDGQPELARLIGYYVMEAAYSGGSRLDEASVKARLSEWLPDYMVPARLVRLDELPLTPNGKLDRKRLPDPAVMDDANLEPPTTDLEALMCVLFAEALNLNQIGRRDNFFARGGQSLRAVSLVAAIEEAIDFRLPVRAIFEYPSVAELCAQLEPPG